MVHRPTKTVKRLVWKPKEQIKGDERKEVRKVKCKTCDKCFIGLTGTRVSSGVREHNLAAKFHDTPFSTSVHDDQERH